MIKSVDVVPDHGYEYGFSVVRKSSLLESEKSNPSHRRIGLLFSKYGSVSGLILEPKGMIPSRYEVQFLRKGAR